jgi:hypothetical protein
MVSSMINMIESLPIKLSTSSLELWFVDRWKGHPSHILNIRKPS